MSAATDQPEFTRIRYELPEPDIARVMCPIAMAISREQAKC